MPTIFSNIKRPCTIIAPSHLHQEIRRQILQDTNGCIGIRILSLQAFLEKHQTNTIHPLQLILSYREQLKNFPTHIFASIDQSLDFLKQCQRFIQEMKLYGCTTEDMPNHNQTQKELKEIISKLYPIQTNQDLENEAFKTIANIKQVYILDTLWSYEDHFRIQKLYKQGAKKLAYPKKTVHTSYVYSINKRKEVEAAAQHIIQKHMDAHQIRIAVCDDSYLPLIKQVFTRYHIPFTNRKQSKASNISIQYQRYFQYCQEPTTANLIDLIHAETESSHLQKDFLEYLQIFQKSFEDSFTHIKENATPSQLITQFDIDRLRQLEINAQTFKEQRKPKLKRLQTTKDPKELCLLIDEYVRMDTHREQDSAIFKSIHQTLETYLPYFHDQRDIPFLIELLKDIKEQETSNHSYGVSVTTMKEPYINGNICMVFGATQSNYPAYPIKTGLFNESYIQNLPSYPSLQVRNHIHRTQLETCLSTFDELRISYPIASYQGKTNESALEMDQFTGQMAQMKEPIEYNHITSTTHKLDPAISHKLFIKDQKLYGSISAFERYMKCPFSYFLTYGLKIREPIEYEFSQSRIGTLTHYILETIVNRHGKDYPHVLLTEIEALMDEQLHHMVQIYPTFQLQLPLLKQRLMNTIQYNLNYMKEMEAHAHIAPYACEHEFWWDIPTKQNITLCMHGFIDRIDASEGYIRIIDYKSSPKSLSLSDVQAGLQLQLLAYALYAKETFQKEVLGVYYYSFLIDTLSAAAGKMKRRPITYVKYNREDYQTQKKARHRLNGWTFHKDADILDDDGTHILGLRKNKDGDIVIRTIHNLDEYKEQFQTMMNTITESILNGHIACEPIKDACTFCKFQSICRFHGFWRKPQPLITQEGEE